MAETELLYEAREVLAAINALIKERPQIAGKLLGSTTLGNHRVHLMAAIERAAGVPAMYKLVPLEPTAEMCAAANEQQSYDHRRGTVTVASNIYRAMVGAAPGVAPSQAPSLAWMVPAMREMAKDLPNNKADALLKWASAIERPDGVQEDQHG